MMTDPRILVVEDSRLDLELAKDLLPWNLAFAVSLGEFADVMDKQQFDVVLLDQQLPDGFATEFLANSDIAKRTKIIGLYGGDVEVARAFMAAGATTVAKKEAYISGAMERIIQEILADEWQLQN